MVKKSIKEQQKQRTVLHLRNKIADRSMKTFKIKETKLSLEEMMKKGSHNHEPSSHSH